MLRFSKGLQTQLNCSAERDNERGGVCNLDFGPCHVPQATTECQDCKGRGTQLDGLLDKKLEAEGGLHVIQPQDGQKAPVCLLSEA